MGFILSCTKCGKKKSSHAYTMTIGRIVCNDCIDPEVRERILKERREMKEYS